MAENTADHLIHLLEIDVAHKDFLSQVRHWDNLKMATADSSIWVKDFTADQLQHASLRSIPFTRLYYLKDNLLFPAGSLLPERKLPSLLWTPIERALPIVIDNIQHSLSQLPVSIKVKLIPVEEEQNVSILVTGMEMAGKYIETAPAVRLQPLEWTLLNNGRVFIKGEPLLPLDGDVYWQKDRFIFPAGYAPEFSVLEKAIAERIDETGEYFIWWTGVYQYCLLHPGVLQPLTIGSWRNTFNSNKIVQQEP
ncbi:MAG: hypothetical protein QM791_09160 [Ferruginibacter sp.]